MSELKLRPPWAIYETRQLLLRKNHKGLGRKLDVPGLRMLAHTQPLFLEELRLQVMLAGRAGRIVQTQIERDSERGFRRAYEPARKYIRARGNAGCSFEEINVMGANSDVSGRG